MDNSSILFTPLDDQVILRSKTGIYRQARIARRGDYVYACVGGGFVMLYANGTTSSPNIRYVDIEGAENYATGSLGRLIPKTVGEVAI